MPVENANNRWTYDGNASTTSFAYDNKIFADADLDVYVDGTLQTLTTDYTVAGAGDDDGGTVDFVSAPADGAAIVIVRDVAYTQESNYVGGGAIPAETVEDDFDRAAIRDQQIKSLVDRALKLAPSDTPESLDDLPLKAARASKYMGWDSDGQPTALAAPTDTALTTTFSETLLDDPDAATARATLGVEIGTDVLAPDGDGSSLTGIFGFSTGDVKLTLKSTADSGWVMMDDGTIGNASSGATTRANADTEELFELLWNNISNTYAPVSGGRGASAQADFDADKTITLPAVLGRALAVSGAGSGLTSRSLGETVGAEDHTLTEAELAAHTHDITMQNLSNDGSGVTTALTPSGTTATASVGSDSAHNNMQPSMFLNVMIKL